MKRFLTTFIIIFAITFVHAGEGMWIPLLLKMLNESEMQEMGMKMSAEDIYSVNQGSLKDAIVHFGGFCTGEVISESGLVLTNHHCGYGSIQRHSTVENNLLRDGYWAATQADELPNPGLFVQFIVRIEDVSKQVLAGVTHDMDPRERQSLVDRNMREVSNNTTRESYQDVRIRPFFKGNQYFLFVTETYHDVRLVGTPPESIGKFGADTDNWEWPRHTGDFSLFRIYAGPDNKPAEYSPDNVPFKPRHALPISLDGVDAGDFSLVFGFPGRTDQYLPASGVEYIANVVDPARIGVRDRALKVMDRYMRADESVRLAYAPRFASIANGWKKWIGEKQGLERTHAVAKIREFESAFTARLAKSPALNDRYGRLLTNFDAAYARVAPYAKARIMYSETFGRNIDLFRTIARLDRLIGTYDNNGAEAFRLAADRQKDYFNAFFADYHAGIDREICGVLLEHLVASLEQEFLPQMLQQDALNKRGWQPANMPGLLFTPMLTTAEGMQKLLDLDGEAFKATLTASPAYQLYTDVQARAQEAINPVYDQTMDQIEAWQREYMAALMEAFPERTFWPDANSTLRVTYGYIEGYQPRDAITYEHVSFLDGVIEKYVPGDYEFDVHPKLIELYNRKDFGKYADKATGKMPVCILGSNHTSGGNSGSPAIDAHGNLVGINFDRVWEGTMSDIYYDRSICRNIMVDIRYVLFVIDKFAGARHLIEEMDLVHPKQKG
ncbi:MAG: S46 family peptidase [Saprospiraceae bacterium]|nr:S46 family peptidase [Saprospiraceae bacterium]